MGQSQAANSQKHEENSAITPRLGRVRMPAVVFRARPIWRYPLRHWLASIRPVPVFHEFHEGWNRRFADRQSQLPAVSGLGGLWRCDAARRSRDRLHPCRLVYARRSRYLGDGRLFVLGTDGYLEISQERRHRGKKSRQPSFSCGSERHALYRLPVWRTTHQRCAGRTDTGMNQAHCPYAMELALKAEKQAQRIDQTV
jgi:hypothetical protein